MKALLFLLSFIFFVTKCQCEPENYRQLLVKLDKLEELVVDGYELFHKEKLKTEKINNQGINDPKNEVNTLAFKIRDLVNKFLELQIPGHGDLLLMIRELVLNINGLKYLVESYEEFNQLMHVINFHYDLLRAKLNDMCAHEYCKIPEHLKINEKELDMLKKVVLGYRKPLDNIKDDIGKMEAFITKNKETIKKINELITAENKKLSGQRTGAIADGTQIARGNSASSPSTVTVSTATVSGGTGSTTTGSTTAPATTTSSPVTVSASVDGSYENEKPIFQAMYNITFYTNQLVEAQKLIEVLEKRVGVLKKHKSIKALLDQIEQEKTNLPNGNPLATDLTPEQEAAKKKITDLEEQIVAIAKTVNFDLDGLFTNTEELEYYLREKAKMTDMLIIPESTQAGSTQAGNTQAGSTHAGSTQAGSTQAGSTPTKTVPSMKESYPHGLTYGLAESTIFELIEKIGSDETFGDLENPDDGELPKKEIIVSEDKRKELMDKIMSKIKMEEEKLDSLKKKYEDQLKKYEEKVKDFQQTHKEFYEARLNNTLVGDKFANFKTKRDAYMTEKIELEKCTYQQEAALIKKLKKQLTYLEDYTLRKDIANDEINSFSAMEWKLKSRIYELSKEVRKNENKLVLENKFDFSGVVELQVQKVLIIKKIEALKNIQNHLKNAKVKDDLYVPKVYKTGEKPEPHYLIVLKKEIDKLKDFIPKIEAMITTEKANLAKEAAATPGQSLRGESETSPTAPAAPAPPAPPAAPAPPAPPAAPAPSTASTPSTPSTPLASPTTTSTSATSNTATEISTSATTTPATSTPDTSTSDTTTSDTPTPSTTTSDTPTSGTPTSDTPTSGTPTSDTPTSDTPTSDTPTPATTTSDTATEISTPATITPATITPATTTPATTTEISIPTTTPTPAAALSPALSPAAPSMSKVEYLEKLLNFLKSAYACHKHIFVTNSTMKKELLDQYKLTTDEENKIKESKCDKLDLIFNVQNNLPAMYSIYDTMSDDLQNLYIELYEKEMIYNIYKNKEKDTRLKALLETTNPVTTVGTVSQGNSTSVVTNTQTTPHEEASHTVKANCDDKPEDLLMQMEMIYEKHISEMDKYNENFNKFLESKKQKITTMKDEEWKALGTEIEQLKKKIQVSLDHYGKYKLKLERFLKKKKKVTHSKGQIKGLTILKNKLERRQNLLNIPTSVLKNFTVFFNKKRESEKKEVENTLKNTEILLNYYKALAKYYMSEPFPLKTISEESLQKEDNYLNLKKFKVLSRMEGRLGDNIQLEKENISYLSSGLHHVFTELKEIIDNKKYSGNDHNKNAEKVKEALRAYQELIPMVATQETAPVPVAPAVTQGPASAVTPAVAPEAPTAEEAAEEAAVEAAAGAPASGEAPAVTVPSATVRAGATTTTTQGGVGEAGATTTTITTQGGVGDAGATTTTTTTITTQEDAGSTTTTTTTITTTTTTTTQGGAGSTSVIAQDYDEDYGKFRFHPFVYKNDDEGYDEEEEENKEVDQVTTGEDENQETPEVIVPPGINEYEVVYIKPLAGMYKTIKKQLENHVTALNTNITDMLDSRFKKRNYFLGVLNFDLNPFKYSSTGDNIIKDPYKLLDLEKKKKMLGGYNYIDMSIEKDLATVNDGLAYYNKMNDLYKKQLDAVNKKIKEVEDEIKKIPDGEPNAATNNQLIAVKEESKSYLPFLNSIKKEYESLVSMVTTYTNNLKKFINNCQIEKRETEIIIKKLEDYSKMDEKLENYRQSKEEANVISSGLLDKLKKSKLINEEESKKILSEVLNMGTHLLNMGSDHKCIDTTVPDNAACYRYLDGREEWRCLLNFKKEGDKCVEASNVTCTDNNGGCAPEAECNMNENNQVVCKCTKEGSEPLYDGVFCSSSSFLSLSFLLLLFLFLLCMEL
uniref:Merozoite surface protein 1 n=1 Tax=Plasmodium inui TaxID=52288 RepID=D4AFL7_9APIC|nr:merozoite surface protein 1 [Plasmodium inui]